MHSGLSEGHGWGQKLSPPPMNYDKWIDIGVLFQYQSGSWSLRKESRNTYTNLVCNILGLILETELKQLVKL